MQRRFTFAVVLAILARAAAAHAADPKFEVQLKKTWVTQVQDLTSVEADMVVHHSHQQPNKVGTGSEDGDLHFSGESDDIGLPFVAEVVNAASENNAVNFIKSTAAANESNPNHPGSIHVMGAWRLWFEHPSTSQIQGADNAFSPDTTNPNHSFEIHPVAIVSTGQKTFDVHDSFVPVQDAKTHKLFKAYPAETAFPYFEGLKTTVKASSSGIAIRSGQLKYNYVDFNIELTQKPKQVDDGFIALANVVGGGDEDPLPSGLRLIFVGGSAGAKAMGTAKSGDSFHVLGIPRVNLNAISFLVSQHGTTQFTAKLPYEMIIVGIYAN